MLTVFLNQCFIHDSRYSFKKKNILVIKTVPGMAMAVAAALDKFQFPEIVGCIAGDDVIMCAIHNVDETLLVMEKLRKLIG